jgi:hypothetical protein
MLQTTTSAGMELEYEDKSSTPPFGLKLKETDKLGNRIEEILWLGSQYAIYRSTKGVVVHFSDCSKDEEEQRQKFAEISPELCELRYLTTEMMKFWFLKNHRGLFEHNMAQAIMLLMEEDKPDDAKALAQKTLDLAVHRVSNDNTIRYIGTCLLVFALCVALGIIFLRWPHFSAPGAQSTWKLFVVCGMFGAAGAVFSIATRLNAFKFRPCNDSWMNYCMGAIRVWIGVVASVVFLLFLTSKISDVTTIHPFSLEAQDWGTTAFGFLAGFAERLIPNVLLRTEDTMETTAGTPVQATRG